MEIKHQKTKSLEAAMNEILQRVEVEMNVADALRKKIAEYNKNEEIQKREDIIRDLRARTFCFSKDDWDNVVIPFEHEHYAMNNSLNQKQQFHRVSYEFTPTEVVDIATVKCSCGAYKDFYY